MTVPPHRSQHRALTQPDCSSSADSNPRPLKRQRIQSSTSFSSDLTSIPSSSDCSPLSKPLSRNPSQDGLRPIPPAVLLVSLPSLLAHPPNHKYYVHSLILSLAALRQCLNLPALPPDIECRAWSGLAELGMRVISGGFSQSEEHDWAKGIEQEVEKSLSRGSIIAHKHPSLRAYKHQLALLQAQLSHWQHKFKFARNQIRTLIASLQPSDPPHIIYTAQLTLITFLTTPNSIAKSTSSFSGKASHNTQPTHHHSGSLTPQPSAQDVHAALAAVQDLEDRATAHHHNQVALLARVLRTRILVAAGMWGDVREAAQKSEAALGLSYEWPQGRKPLQPSQSNAAADASALPPAEQTFIMFEDAFEAAMAVHLLMLTVVYFTHTGEAKEVSPRLSHLHALLDSEVLDKFPDGLVELQLPDSPSLVVQVTHPRVLFLLAFLISSVSKRDAVGRKPKRKVFAIEGLATWNVEASHEILFSPWASVGDVEEVEQRLARIKADMLCEVVAVSIMRSEFDTAEENLDMLISHTRTYDIFPFFAGRIALHHAHLAHALARPARALRCYQAAAYHSDKHSFVHVAARAGEITLRTGMRRRRAAMGDDWHQGLSANDDPWPDGLDDEDDEDNEDDEGLRAQAMDVVKACRGMGAALEAIGEVLQACFTPEILKSKQHLKHALELATRAQDNHLRALVLALISAHYLHTAGDHARGMLYTCEQLAAGLGAVTKPAAGGPKEQCSEDTPGPKETPVGNAPLGLWVGERFLELYKRFGKDARAQKQMAVNARFASAMQKIVERGAGGASSES